MRAKTKQAVVRVFPRAPEVKRKLQQRGFSADPRMLRQLRQLRARVVELESEVQEARRLNKRVAELVDLAGHVLLPLEKRDDEAVRESLARYVDDLE